MNKHGEASEGDEMGKLKMLLAQCKCGVHLTINDHRDVYKPVAEALDRRPVE